MRTAHQNSISIYTLPATAHSPELYTQKATGVYKYMPRNLGFTALPSVASHYSQGPCTFYRRSVRSKKKTHKAETKTAHTSVRLSDCHGT
jgi:hypothetical protein